MTFEECALSGFMTFLAVLVFSANSWTGLYNFAVCGTCVLFTFHCVWVLQGEIHRKRLAREELNATFDWQSPSYMWDQHWRHDSSLGRKSESGKGQSIHRHRKIALLCKTFHCTSCSSTCSYRGSTEKGRLFAVSWRSLLMFWSGPMSEWRNRSRI